MQRGQYFTVLKLLQAAVLAAVLIGIVYGIVKYVESVSPGTGVAEVSVNLLKSAYSSRDTRGTRFTGEAFLQHQEFQASALGTEAGLPDDPNVHVYVHCTQGFCEPDNCDRNARCGYIKLEGNPKVRVCACCNDDGSEVNCIISMGVSREYDCCDDVP